MRAAVLVLVLAAACGAGTLGELADGGGSSGTCPTALAPTSAGQPANAALGPTSVDGAGTDFCLRLDTRKLGRAHFMADTPDASVTLQLRGTDGSKIQDGWDVAVSSGTFENLEWSPAAGQVIDVVLHVAAKSGSASTRVSVSLFDPLD
jgi:hypothetical protein